MLVYNKHCILFQTPSLVILVATVRVHSALLYVERTTVRTVSVLRVSSSSLQTSSGGLAASTRQTMGRERGSTRCSGGY